MYQDFKITAIEPKPMDKKIIIATSFDVDPETVTEANIKLISKTDRNEVGYSAMVTGKSIELTLTDWPTPTTIKVIREDDMRNVTLDGVAYFTENGINYVVKERDFILVDDVKYFLTEPTHVTVKEVPCIVSDTGKVTIPAIPGDPLHAVERHFTVDKERYIIKEFEYILSIQNLKTVLGDKLSSGIRTGIVFKSSICSIVNVTYPVYDEVITDLKATWTETLADDTHVPVNSFYVEIAKKVSFYETEIATPVTGALTVDFRDLPGGQYYIRVRAQKDGEYGAWSNVSTFFVGKEAAKPEPPYIPTDEFETSYIPDINILDFPVDGSTPSSIVIEFDCDIYQAILTDIKNIEIVRRDV